MYSARQCHLGSETGTGQHRIISTSTSGHLSEQTVAQSGKASRSLRCTVVSAESPSWIIRPDRGPWTFDLWPLISDRRYLKSNRHKDEHAVGRQVINRSPIIRRHAATGMARAYRSTADPVEPGASSCLFRWTCRCGCSGQRCRLLVEALKACRRYSGLHDLVSPSRDSHAADCRTHESQDPSSPINTATMRIVCRTPGPSRMGEPGTVLYKTVQYSTGHDASTASTASKLQRLCCT
jgi:hypothetical protein